jgi:hypothetical protein
MNIMPETMQHIARPHAQTRDQIYGVKVSTRVGAGGAQTHVFINWDANTKTKLDVLPAAAAQECGGLAGSTANP